MEDFEIMQETSETPYIPEDIEAAEPDTERQEAGDALPDGLESLITDDETEPAEGEAVADGAEAQDAGEKDEKKFTQAVDFDGVKLTGARLAKKEMRESQLKAEGIDGGMAEYVATIEQVNQQYREDREALQGDAGVMAETAAILGMSPTDFTAQIKEWAIDAAASGRAKEYMDQGYDAEVANKLALADIRADIAEKAVQQKQAGQAADEAIVAEIKKVHEAYPETRAMEKMPPEVLENFQNGMTPLEAYQHYLLSQARAEAENKAKAAEGAKKAAGKSPGSATSQKEDDNLDVGAVFMANYGKY